MCGRELSSRRGRLELTFKSEKISQRVVTVWVFWRWKICWNSFSSLLSLSHTQAQTDKSRRLVEWRNELINKGKRFCSAPRYARLAAPSSFVYPFAAVLGGGGSCCVPAAATGGRRGLYLWNKGKTSGFRGSQLATQRRPVSTSFFQREAKSFFFSSLWLWFEFR